MCCFTWILFLYLAVYQYTTTTLTEIKLPYIFSPASYKRIVWYLWVKCDYHRLFSNNLKLLGKIGYWVALDIFVSVS